VSATVVMDLVAAALVAGLPEPQAVAAAAEVCGSGVQARLAQPLDAWRLGIPAEQAWARVDPAFAPMGRSLVLAERTGASAAVVLTAAASDARSARQRRALVAARRLGVQLVLPLGLTTLPAFVMWGVVPVVLGLAEQLLVER
jgi:tight adherence protein B